jgi:uncharacterized protein (TIGR03663 family)
MHSKAQQWFLIAGLLFAVLVALALRLPELSVRPMHNDEAVNAIKFRALMEQGSYRYDPNEYHGPTLYYFTLAWTKLTGVSDFEKLTEARLRGLTVLFGIGLIILLPLARDGLGRIGMIFAASFIAISPAMVFYSRYYIHEMLLVFFTFLAIAAGWRWFCSRKIGWAIVAGSAIGLMHATKETFVLALAAIAIAVFLNGKWIRAPLNFRNRGACGKVIGVVVVSWLIVAAIFFSSFFTHPSGVLDSVKTFLPMAHRAAGDAVHVHQWNFYFERLLFFHAHGGPIWSEALVAVLALIGMLSAFTRRGASDSSADFGRFIAFYTVFLAAIYISIPYKTPWCVLGFWHGAILLAGLGAAALVNLASEIWMKAIVALAILAGGFHLGFQSWRASTTFCADQRNPYVYAQTSPDVLELVNAVESVARISPENQKMIVHVIAPENDYWPLPWYLRNFDHVGWWDEVPDVSSASVVIASQKSAAKLDESTNLASIGNFQLRPGNFFEMYVRRDLLQTYIESKSKSKQ